MAYSEQPAARAAANLAVTAAAGQDNQAQTGVIIDRSVLGYPDFVRIHVPYSAVLGANNTFTLKDLYLEHSAESNMGNAANYYTGEDANGTAVAKGGANGTTETGVQIYACHLGAAKQYIRLKYTPDLSASGTDTLAISAEAVFSRPARVP